MAQALGSLMWLTTDSGGVVTAAGSVGFRVTLTACLSQYSLRDSSEHKERQFVARCGYSGAFSLADAFGHGFSITGNERPEGINRGPNRPSDAWLLPVTRTSQPGRVGLAHCSLRRLARCGRHIDRRAAARASTQLRRRGRWVRAARNSAPPQRRLLTDKC